MLFGQPKSEECFGFNFAQDKRETMVSQASGGWTQGSFILVDKIQGMTDPQWPMTKIGSPIIVIRSFSIGHRPEE